jgi:ribosome recycling factor
MGKNNKILTSSQIKEGGYKELEEKIRKFEDKYDKQFDKIFKILHQLINERK